MKVVAVLHARGRGTSLPRKNAYLLNGKPLIWHFLTEMKKASCLDHIFVWTEDAEIARITEDCGCHALARPLSMIHYGSGFHTSEEWGKHVADGIRAKIGQTGDIGIHLNCNYVLFTAASLDAMYDKLMEDDTTDIIYPIYEVEPHLYMLNPATNRLFPVWEQPGLDRQDFPPLYRRVGISVHYPGRSRRKGPPRETWLKVQRHEGLDFQGRDDIPFAEFMLARRAAIQSLEPVTCDSQY